MAASDSSKPDETISAAVAPRDGHRRAAQADDPRATEAPIEVNRIGATDRLIHRMPLVPAVVLMVLGIGLAEWLQPRSLWWLALPAGALCVAATVALAKQQRQWSMIYGWLALLWIGATVHFVQRQPSSDELGDVASRDFQPLVFRVELLGGAIWSPNSAFRSGDPTGHRWRTQWKVRCYQVRDGANWRDVDCRSTLSVVGRIDDLWPGDRLLVFGNCARVSAPSNPGQNDLRPIFRSEGQFVFLRADSADQMERIDSSWRRPLARWLAYATYRIDRALHTYVALDQGALASALVFGQRQQVDWYAQQQLLSTGTLHMLAISGMHIELVAGALWIVCLLGGVPLRWTLLVVATVVVLYGLIAGANPPVLRAVFMVLAVCAARWRGRRRGLANLLAFSGLAVLSIRTTWLANVGVQLSFLAVATIAIFVTRGPSTRSQRLSAQQAERMTALASVLEESWNWRKRLMVTLGRWSWQMTCLSFWVWLMTAPLIWSNFHVVSPVAIPLNIVLWPLLVISLLSGLALAVLWWIPLLASLLGFICGGSLWLVGLVVYWGDRVAGGHVWLPAPSHGWLLIFYALAAGGIGLITIFPRWRSALGVVLCSWLVIGMIPWWCGPRGMAPDGLRVSSLAAWSPSVPEELRLTFIDVGHGTSVVAELPTGEVWLYDAGHLGSADRSHQQIADVLWSLPTARIDRLFLSHADADHYNAVPGLLQRFRIGQVAAPSAFWQHLAPELGTLRQTLQAYRVPRADLAMGDQAHLGQVRIEALHPPANWLEKTDNANSLTLLVEYAGRRCLLPGDLEKGGLARLLASPPRTADILMAPHHGSLTHDPLPLIQWSQPSWIVISGGARAGRPEVIQRYTVANTTTAITHRDGAIQFRIAPSGSLHVWHWHENQWLQWSD